MTIIKVIFKFSYNFSKIKLILIVKLKELIKKNKYKLKQNKKDIFPSIFDRD